MQAEFRHGLLAPGVLAKRLAAGGGIRTGAGNAGLAARNREFVSGDANPEDPGGFIRTSDWFRNWTGHGHSRKD